MIIFYDLSLVIQHFLISKLGVEYAASLIIIAVFLVGMILALYFFIKGFGITPVYFLLIIMPIYQLYGGSTKE